MTPAPRRYFVASFPDEETKSKVVAARTRIAEQLPEGAVRFGRVEYMHATLVYLGIIDDETAQQVIEIVGDVIRAWEFDSARVSQPVDVRCLRIFGRGDVIGLELAGDAIDAMYTLRNSVVSAMESNGLPHDERDWLPHMSIMRARRSRHIAVDAVGDFPFEFDLNDLATVRFERIALVRSTTMSPNGPHHDHYHVRRLSVPKQ